MGRAGGVLSTKEEEEVPPGHVVRTLQYVVPEDAALHAVVLVYSRPPNELHASFRTAATNPETIAVLKLAARGAAED